MRCRRYCFWRGGSGISAGVKPNPKQFKSITDYRLAQEEQARKQSFLHKLTGFIWGAILTSLAIIGAINYPSYALAILCLGGAIVVLVAGEFLREARQETKEYQDEHNL